MRAHFATAAAKDAPIRGVVWRILVAGALLSVVVLWACLAQPLNLSALSSDGGMDGTSSTSDGNAALIGQFTMGGCSELSFPGTEVHCVGTAPLRVTLVLIQIGATTHRWKVVAQNDVPDGGATGDGGAVDGGSAEVSLLSDTASRANSPSVLLRNPGTYQVTLGVAGPGGTATAAGTIVVNPVILGGACANDGQCSLGLRCLCGTDTPGRDGSCPGGLMAGMCTRSCDGLACPGDSVCLDLSRTKGTGMDGGTGDAWRQPICVPTCSGGQRCRADLTCRELPALPPGGHAGDPAYVFSASCFLSTPGGVGDSCITSDSQPDPAACATGVCEPLGLRNLCTASCVPGCPTSAACANWNSPLTPAPTGPRCLLRCDAMTPCADPLLNCLPSGGPGPLGFTLPTEPAGTMVCAPRSCTMAADCPGGRCAPFVGGSFCLRN